jgi:Tfp pilus assembly protein PilF
VGNHNQAIADLGTAIRLDPKFAPAYAARGAVFELKKNNYRAIADYSEAIRLDPQNAGTYIARARAYRAVGQRANASRDERTAQMLKK